MKLSVWERKGRRMPAGEETYFIDILLNDTRKCLLLREMAPAMRRGGASVPGGIFRCRRRLFCLGQRPFREEDAAGGVWACRF
jgi:hypothetical protein